MTFDPAAFFARHGLPLPGLHRAPLGHRNEVWMTDTAVLRVGPHTDHAREATVALAALAAGVHTARPLAWGGGYGLWERLPGRSPTPQECTPSLWSAVLEDLERLHARPPQGFAPRDSAAWTGDPALVDRTQDRARWTPDERAALLGALREPYPLTAPVFVHGDVYRDNLLVDERGAYAGMIDWGNARWATREHECACLDDLSVALARWRARLDVGLVWRVRLELLLVVADAGRAPFSGVRLALREIGAAP